MEWEGDTLEMVRISRLGMGAYLCIASNGVPPAVSKQIKVSVDCEWNKLIQLIQKYKYLNIFDYFMQ